MRIFLLSALMLVSNVSLAAAFLKVVPGKISNFERVPAEKTRLIQSFDIIEAVINSEEFKELVIQYKGKGKFGGYTSHQGLTNEQIYEKIMSGKEVVGGTQTLMEMNFDVSRYVPILPSHVIGRTYVGLSNLIEVNGRKYAFLSPADMAANLTHEWIHLLGFLHTNAEDLQSVPYAVGDIMQKLAEKYLAQGFLH